MDNRINVQSPLNEWLNEMMQALREDRFQYVIASLAEHQTLADRDALSVLQEMIDEKININSPRFYPSYQYYYGQDYVDQARTRYALLCSLTLLLTRILHHGKPADEIQKAVDKAEWELAIYSENREEIEKVLRKGILIGPASQKVVYGNTRATHTLLDVLLTKCEDIDDASKFNLIDELVKKGACLSDSIYAHVSQRHRTLGAFYKAIANDVRSLFIWVRLNPTFLRKCDENKMTLLHHVASLETIDKDVMQLIWKIMVDGIKQNDNINSKSAENASALCYAIDSMHLQFAENLLSLGANPDHCPETDISIVELINILTLRLHNIIKHGPNDVYEERLRTQIQVYYQNADHEDDSVIIPRAIAHLNRLKKRVCLMIESNKRYSAAMFPFWEKRVAKELSNASEQQATPNHPCRIQ